MDDPFERAKIALDESARIVAELLKRQEEFDRRRRNPPPTCEELLRIADEMGGRDMMRFAR